MKFSKFSLAIAACLTVLAGYVIYAGYINSPRPHRDNSASPPEININKIDSEYSGSPGDEIRKYTEKAPSLDNTVKKVTDANTKSFAASAGHYAMAFLRGQETVVNAAKAMASLSARAANNIVASSDGIIRGKITRGDTLSKILDKAGCPNTGAYVSAAQKVFSLRQLQDGHPYLVQKGAKIGDGLLFEYEIDDQRRLVVAGGAQPAARVEKIDYDIRLASASGVIEDNLFQTVADIGEKPRLALKLVELFGSEINFIKDLQSGDSFSALLEKRYLDGVFRGYGRFLAATFTNRGKKFEAYLFPSANGKPQYYNAKGENLHKTLLQMPLAFTRVTSRFTHKRRHPILGYNRPHLGVDYSAPSGTPVKAVGDGTVTTRERSGGYGNLIVIKHDAGLESMYAHLSGFARGLREGQKVAQGQVIGFVGSTGLSTGPHLDFRLRQNGVFIDPAKAINPRGAPVGAPNMKEFTRIMLNCRAYLEGTLDMGKYTVDSMAPMVVSSKQTAELAGTRSVSKPASARKYGAGKRLKKAESARRNARHKKRR